MIEEAKLQKGKEAQSSEQQQLPEESFQHEERSTQGEMECLMGYRENVDHESLDPMVFEAMVDSEVKTKTKIGEQGQQKGQDMLQSGGGFQTEPVVGQATVQI